jgi:hypothetical protein
MVASIRKFYISDMEGISWMDPETKRMAVKKVTICTADLQINNVNCICMHGSHTFNLPFLS